MSLNFPPPRGREAWRQQEQRLDEDGTAKRVPGSGCGVQKGDNKGLNFLIQCKTTAYKQITLKQDDWAKTCKDARREDRMPVMQLQLQDRDRLAVLDWETFSRLVSAAGLIM